MSEKTRKKPLQRILVGFFGLFFLISSGGFVVRLLLNNDESSAPSASESSLDEQLATRARGYEKVIEREPDNALALRGLVEIRLQMQDYQGAIAPMEKLIELYPEQEEFKALLAVIKQQVEVEQVNEEESESQ